MMISRLLTDSSQMPALSAKDRHCVNLLCISTPSHPRARAHLCRSLPGTAVQIQLPIFTSHCRSHHPSFTSRTISINSTSSLPGTDVSSSGPNSFSFSLIRSKTSNLFNLDLFPSRHSAIAASAARAATADSRAKRPKGLERGGPI